MSVAILVSKGEPVVTLTSTFNRPHIDHDDDEGDDGENGDDGDDGGIDGDDGDGNYEYL